MKKILFTFLFVFFFQIGSSQSVSHLLNYKGFPVEDIEYYYLTAENRTSFTNDIEIYTNVKKFTCDKSKYEDHIKNLTTDIEAQFGEYLGTRKPATLEVRVYYFKSLRDANLQHRREVNQGKVNIDYEFVYYCLE